MSRRGSLFALPCLYPAFTTYWSHCWSFYLWDTIVMIQQALAGLLCHYSQTQGKHPAGHCLICISSVVINYINLWFRNQNVFPSEKWLSRMQKHVRRGLVFRKIRHVNTAFAGNLLRKYSWTSCPNNLAGMLLLGYDEDHPNLVPLTVSDRMTAWMLLLVISVALLILPKKDRLPRHWLCLSPPLLGSFCSLIWVYCRWNRPTTNRKSFISVSTSPCTTRGMATECDCSKHYIEIKTSFSFQQICL